jgi:hypothetical protein
LPVDELVVTGAFQNNDERNRHAALLDLEAHAAARRSRASDGD